MFQPHAFIFPRVLCVLHCRRKRERVFLPSCSYGFWDQRASRAGKKWIKANRGRCQWVAFWKCPFFLMSHLSHSLKTKTITCFRNHQQFKQSVRLVEEETTQLLPVRKEAAALTQRYRLEMNFVSGKRLRLFSWGVGGSGWRFGSWHLWLQFFLAQKKVFPRWDVDSCGVSWFNDTVTAIP